MSIKIHFESSLDQRDSISINIHAHVGQDDDQCETQTDSRYAQQYTLLIIYQLTMPHPPPYKLHTTSYFFFPSLHFCSNPSLSFELGTANWSRLYGDTGTPRNCWTNRKVFSVGPLSAELCTDSSRLENPITAPTAQFANWQEVPPPIYSECISLFLSLIKVLQHCKNENINTFITMKKIMLNKCLLA